MFEIAQWDGVIKPDDPDALVLQCRFVSVDDAVELLEALPSLVMKQPAIAFLRDASSQAELWEYRRDEQGRDIRIGR